ncbi:hypothetical protein SARC_09003 [Sphaeroforma arctica JP610]|uniref:Uncharacterized protein n=1 Tax=Sphaeroforma arctica JP610 TaxID=667725 RepID=A0A0L0FP40_9EUKA|nr:hypothetical protein SARC_09003 [Sphaeroforma arctica JP610]KNC78575.1 hypothetical protein SARC_09003 [Sphaeroforma arctica JP610]|eukprot:XP_014152477.1 hypothetical protein SARC_09003 [Sphaeroforma arctica JP610]
MGRIGILKLFHSHQETRSKDQPRITDPVVLLAACVGISVDSISYLIELGMCANTCFPQGHRPLHAVVKCGITRCEGSFRALMGQFKRREIYQRSDRTTRDADLHGIATIGTGSEIPGVRMGQSSHERPLRRPIHVTNGRAGDIAYTRRRLETDETHSSTHGDTHNTAQGERDERIQRWPHISTVGVTNSHAHHAASGALQNGARHDADESVHAHAVYGTHSRTHGGSRVYKTIPLLTKCQFNCHYDRICTCQHDRYKVSDRAFEVFCWVV